MKSPIDMNETEIRARFDFSKATRGRYADRYEHGRAVMLLDRDPDEVDATLLAADAVESTRQSGMRIFESQVRNAGLRLVEPSDNHAIDYLISSETQPDVGTSLPVKLKTSMHEVFSLYKKDSRIPRLLVAYVWHAKGPRASEVYALTYDEALEIVKNKPYFSSKSWMEEGGYSVTHAGAELREKLKEYRMTPERWLQRLRSI